MNVYRNCDELSIYLFDKIIKTGSLFWLLEGYFEGEEVKIKEDLPKIWEEIYTEYCDLTDDNHSFKYFKLLQKVVFLETRIYICQALILQLVERGQDIDEKIRKEYIEQIKKWGVPYKKEIVDLEEIEKAVRFLNLSRNELGLKKHEMKELAPKGEPTPLTKQVVLAEQALGRNNIDPKKTSVTKWVYMMNVIEENNKSRKNGSKL